jgi:transposase InsO family protein
VNDRYTHIQQLAPQHPVTVLCGLLDVSRSGYYGWCGRASSPRQQEDARLAAAVKQTFLASRRTYGRGRVTRELKDQGHRCGERRVARLLREQALCARPRRRFRVVTTDSRHDGPIAPNRLAGLPAPTRPDAVWVTDFTFIPTGESWLFLAVVLDLYSRRVVGWAFSARLDTALALTALHMALRQRRPAPGLIHHSDRGVQYASAEYRAELAAHGLVASMSRTGNPYDNAAMESFYSTLKIECLHREDFATRAQAQAAAFDYIEAFYNRRRRHSALGYKNPVDFERQLN